ncbi:hypothetical protein ACERII_17810 [Evansella sp. AB-rgal1]|uniref:hypothetical protein n=1 Tax=Evansella sp. AB-rgal1 TaxID=3242696 RepID=UPI00359EFECB
MSNKDFRVQVPLWNIALWIVLMIWTYGVAHAVDMIISDFEGVYVVSDNGLQINWHVPGMLSIIIGTFLLLVFFATYFLKIRRYNEKNPNNKVGTFTFIKPGEFLEDDEMLRQVTESATKKVYILYSQALPLLIFFIVIFPLERYVYVVMIILLLIVHNALYYLEIRRFLSGDYNLSTKRKSRNNRLQKVFTVFLILAFILAIAIPIGRIIQIEINHSETLQEFEACIKEGRTATMEYEENGFASVECE